MKTGKVQEIKPATPPITDVICDYTGGGIYCYKARCGELWLYGSLDQYVCAYDADPCPNDDWDDADFDFETHYVEPDFPLPSWNLILESLKDCPVADARETLIYWNKNWMDKPCNHDPRNEYQERKAIWMTNAVTSRQLYDELSALLTDYEGNGSDNPVTIDDMYAMLVKIQNNWEQINGEC